MGVEIRGGWLGTPFCKYKMGSRSSHYEMINQPHFFALHFEVPSLKKITKLASTKRLWKHLETIPGVKGGVGLS